MNKQHEKFKEEFPNGVVLFDSVSAGEAVIVQAKVFTAYPEGLVGSAQALVLNPDDFEEAEQFVASEALTRAGFIKEVDEEAVEIENHKEEFEAEKSAQVQDEDSDTDEEETAEEPETGHRRTPPAKSEADKASGTDAIMNKYSHLLGGSKNKSNKTA